VIACSAGVLAAGTTGAQQAENRNQQRVLISVVDKKGEPVTSLSPADLTVREDGRVREVLSVQPATGPMEIALLADTSTAENHLTQQLRSLFAVAEAYPELKAAENFRQLSATLVAVENDIQFARRYYNGSVRDLNNLVQTFPSQLVARGFGFGQEEFFEIETTAERNAPTVRL